MQCKLHPPPPPLQTITDVGDFSITAPVTSPGHQSGDQDECRRRSRRSGLQQCPLEAQHSAFFGNWLTLGQGACARKGCVTCLLVGVSTGLGSGFFASPVRSHLPHFCFLRPAEGCPKSVVYCLRRKYRRFQLTSKPTVLRRLLANNWWRLPGSNPSIAARHGFFSMHKADRLSLERAALIKNATFVVRF